MTKYARYLKKELFAVNSLSKLRGIFAMPMKFVKGFFNPWSLTFKSMLNPTFVSDHGNFNKKEILKLEIGSGNGLGSARGLATIMNGLIDESSPIYLGNSTLATIMEQPPDPSWDSKIELSGSIILGFTVVL